MKDKRFMGRAKRVAGELTVIVLGVLIALTADAAMQARDESELAADLVERLVQDLRADSTFLAVYIPAIDAVQAAGNRLIDELEGGPPVPNDSLVALARTASGQPSFPAIRRSTYVELISTGSLGLIPEAQRVQILDYYEQLQHFERGVEGIGSIEPAPWEYSLPNEFIFDQSFEVPVTTVRAAVLESPSALRDLRKHTNLNMSFVMIMEAIYQEALGTLEALTGDLE